MRKQWIVLFTMVGLQLSAQASSQNTCPSAFESAVSQSSALAATNSSEFIDEQSENFLIRRYEQPMTYKQILTEITKLRQKWAYVYKRVKGKVRYASAQDAVAIFKVRGLPDTYLTVFSNNIQMNSVFNRASSYVESKILPKDVDQTQQALTFGNGGHDLRSVDLREFWLWFQEVGDLLTSKTQSVDEKKVLAIEQEGWRKIILPLIGDSDKKTMIAIALGGRVVWPQAVLSHELDHAQYFEQPPFKRAILDYWSNMLAEDKAGIRAHLAATGLYNPEDENLMMNEFQAYTLEYNDHADDFSVYRDAHRKPLITFLESRGIKFVAKEK